MSAKVNLLGQRRIPVATFYTYVQVTRTWPNEPELVATPSASGKGQTIARCATCKVAVWSNYPQAGPAVRFVRVGTLDEPHLCPPDIHIYTSGP